MADVLMFQDNSYYNERLRQMSLYVDDFNLILSDYNALGLPALTVSEFLSLMNNPKDVIFDKMTNGQPLTLNGLPVDRTKALELVVFPTGTDILVEEITGFKLANPGWGQSRNIDIVNGVIVVSQTAKDTELEASKIYAKTTDEKNLYAFVQDIIASATARFGNQAKVNIPVLVQRTILNNASVGSGNTIDAGQIRGYKIGMGY